MSRVISQEQRDAMSAGRRESEAIRRYIEHLRERGTQHRNVNYLKQLETAERNLSKAKASGNLLDQIKYDSRIAAIKKQLRQSQASRDIVQLESDFVDNVVSYSAKHDITKAIWRKYGVPMNVLDRVDL